VSRRKGGTNRSHNQNNGYAPNPTHPQNILVSLQQSGKYPCINIIVGMAQASSLVSANYVDANWMVIALMALAFFGKGLAAVGGPCCPTPSQKAWWD